MSEKARALEEFIAGVRRIEQEWSLRTSPAFKPEEYALLEFHDGRTSIGYGKLVEELLREAFSQGAFAGARFDGLSDSVLAEDGCRLAGLVRWLDEEERAAARGFLVAGVNPGASPFDRLADALAGTRAGDGMVSPGEQAKALGLVADEDGSSVRILKITAKVRAHAIKVGYLIAGDFEKRGTAGTFVSRRAWELPAAHFQLMKVKEAETRKIAEKEREKAFRKIGPEGEGKASFICTNPNCESITFRKADRYNPLPRVQWPREKGGSAARIEKGVSVSHSRFQVSSEIPIFLPFRSFSSCHCFQPEDMPILRSHRDRSRWRYEAWRSPKLIRNSRKTRRPKYLGIRPNTLAVWRMKGCGPQDF